MAKREIQLHLGLQRLQLLMYLDPQHSEWLNMDASCCSLELGVRGPSFTWDTNAQVRCQRGEMRGLPQALSC